MMFSVYVIESTHTKATFREIPKGVLNKLEKLTPITEDNFKIRVNENFPSCNRSQSSVHPTRPWLLKPPPPTISSSLSLPPLLYCKTKSLFVL